MKHTKRFRQFILGTILPVLLFSSCTDSIPEDSGISTEPDYTSSAMWYDTKAEGALSDKDVDIFYITPTCVWDWKDDSGKVYHYMNVGDAAQRAAVDGSNYLAFKLFEKSCNFYSPYYRQITMDCWFKPAEEIERLYKHAHQDIVSAYHYYMEHFNQGKPFILAGHSQGAKAVVELLKHTVSDEEYGRMVAAYVFGFEISAEELLQFPKLHPASGAEDTGCLICYNSVSTPDALSPLFSNNRVCINPVNWKTDTTYAPAAENLGSVFFGPDRQSDTLHQTVGVRLVPELHTLQIDGLDDERFYIPEIAKLFPKGNYHVQELNLYFLNLQENLKVRIERFRKR